MKKEPVKFSREWFQAQGSLGGKKGGRIGGMIAATHMSPEALRARAMKGVEARRAKRAVVKLKTPEPRK